MYEYKPKPLDLSDDSLTNSHWPKGGQNLFLKKDDWAQTAVFDTSKSSWTGYALTYQDAATTLYEAATAKGANLSDMDNLFIPFAYLWRQSTEIWLKGAIAFYSRILRTHIDPDALITHKLDVLWNEHFAPLEERIHPDTPKADKAHARRIVMQLHNFDPTSTQLRYPTFGNQRHLQGRERVAMRNFHDVMLGVSAWISAGVDKAESENF
jgi:hypothetical protein